MHEQNISSEQRLNTGLAMLGIEVDKGHTEKLMDYLQLLMKWNKVHNLTSITDPCAMVDIHVLDSLSVLNSVKGPTLLDVGSGAGLPGMILAIMRPDIQVCSVDSRGKKVQFQTLVASSLGLENFQAIHSRVEDYEFEAGFTQIISRAFSSLESFIMLTKHLLADNGEWLAMKGQLPTEELEKLNGSLSVVPIKIEALTLPNFIGERHLLTFKP